MTPTLKRSPLSACLRHGECARQGRRRNKVDRDLDAVAEVPDLCGSRFGHFSQFGAVAHDGTAAQISHVFTSGIYSDQVD